MRYQIFGLCLLNALLSTPAFGDCPDKPSAAEIRRKGGAIVTAKVIELGPVGDRRLPEWARMKVLKQRYGKVPDVFRVLAPDTGLYTAVLVVGETYTFHARAPLDRIAISMCDMRKP